VLFTDLDELVEGDIFIIYTLNETLTYEVDQIRIVEPDELEDLEIIEGEDLCTLVTCTPYGINSHRLLVRGHRTENRTETLVTMDATQIDTTLVAGVIAAGMLFLLMVGLLIVTIAKSSRKSRERKARDLKAPEQADNHARAPDEKKPEDVGKASEEEKPENAGKASEEEKPIDAGNSPDEEKQNVQKPRRRRKEAGQMEKKQNTLRRGSLSSAFLLAVMLTAALLLTATVLVCFFGLSVHAKELPDLDATGSITIELCDSATGDAIAGATMELYLVAAAETENADYWWSYTGEFTGCAYSLGDLTSRTLPTALADYVSANDISPLDTAKTDENGSIVFADLSVGLYLIVQTETADGYELLTPFLVTVPLENEEDGSWIYDVEALPKPGTVNPETETSAPVDTETEEPQTGETEQSEPPVETETESEAQSEPFTETDPEREAQSELSDETDPEREVQSESSGETDAESEAQSETPDETVTESDTESETSGGTGTGTEGQSGKTSESDISSTTDAVQTGDETPLGRWVAVLLISAAVLLVMDERKRQRKQI